jgi:hypothetical protein
MRVAQEEVCNAYTCAECHNQGHTTENLPADLKLWRVEWQQAPEDLDTVRRSGTPEAINRLEELLAAKMHSSGQPAKRQRTVEISRQALLADDQERVYDITIGQQIRHKLVIHTEPINPHADIAPPGKQCAYIRPITYADGEGRIASKDVSCLYGANGRCEHMISPGTVAHLRTRFLHMQQVHPDLMQQWGAGTFEEELHRVALRYRSPSDHIMAERMRHWGLSSKLKHTLLAAIKSTTERFSSPLTVHPTCTTYWTEHKRDRVFGASYDAYAARWSGPSLAVPDFDVHAATRAVDWAIRSAKAASVPTVTLLVLPTFFAEDDDTPYMQLLRRNYATCTPVCTFNREALPFEPPAHLPLAKPQPLKWRFRLVAVGNEQGYRENFTYLTETGTLDFKSQ